MDAAFLGKLPPELATDAPDLPRHLAIEGGDVITGLRILDADPVVDPDPTRDDVLLIRLDREGDHSRYRLRLVGQDCGRGTFFHRHAVVHDQKTGDTWVAAIPATAVNPPGVEYYLSSTPSAAATAFVDAFAASRPGLPVDAFAQPAFTSTARSLPSAVHFAASCLSTSSVPQVRV